MCRLTAYLGDPLPLDTLVFGGPHSLFVQSWAPKELLSGSVNADGWGVAWYHEGRPVRLARPEPVWHADGLDGTLHAIRSPLAVAAIRNTTTGLPVVAPPIAPVIFEQWTFVLNGFVPSFRAHHMRSLRASLSDRLYASLVGVSDTETLFLLAVESLERGASLTEALDHVVRITLDEVADREECQLTMLLSDGEALAAVRTSNRDRVNSLYRMDRGSMAPGGTLLASEPLDGDDRWTAVPERTAVEIRRGRRARPPDPGPET